jgi:hypothetical protein
VTHDPDRAPRAGGVASSCQQQILLTASVPGRTLSQPSQSKSTKAHPAKAGAAKPRVLASSATPFADATKDPKTAELPKGGSAFVRVQPSKAERLTRLA